MRRFECDRCKKQVKVSGDLFNIDIKTGKCNFFNVNYIASDSMDICRSCMDKLDKLRDKILLDNSELFVAWFKNEWFEK